jgi:hypothetical protein
MAMKRGRPHKFGRPARTIAITIPEDIIEALQRTDTDLGRAVVALVDDGGAASFHAAGTEPVGVAPAESRHFLSVVDPRGFPPLPGCSLLRIAADRALITLTPGARLADLELQIIDRLAEIDTGSPEHRSLLALRGALKGWRTNQRIAVLERSIIVPESATGARA